MRLTNKLAIVTGAGSGFGAGIARRFAEEGARVVVNDIDAKSGERVAKEIGGTFIEADVTRGEDWARLVRAAGPALDIVVNNAGWTHRNKPFLEVTEPEFDRVYSVNVKSIFLSALHAVPVLKKRGGMHERTIREMQIVPGAGIRVGVHPFSATPFVAAATEVMCTLNAGAARANRFPSGDGFGGRPDDVAAAIGVGSFVSWVFSYCALPATGRRPRRSRSSSLPRPPPPARWRGRRCGRHPASPNRPVRAGCRDDAADRRTPCRAAGRRGASPRRPPAVPPTP